jgi:hypothetical protein
MPPTLTEGLIAVPPKMFAPIWRLVQRQVLWWAADRLNSTKGDFSHHVIAVKVLASEAGIEIPDQPFPNDIAATYVNCESTNMPASYQKLIPDREQIIAAVQWTNDDNSLGSWMPNKGKGKGILVIRPLSCGALAKWPERGYPEAIDYTLSVLRDTVEHELRHVVQYVWLRGIDPSQVEIKAGYNSGGGNRKANGDYYRSQVEFDPSIGSAVNDFMQEWRLAKEYEMNPRLKKAIRTFVALDKSDTFGLFANSSFFKALRNGDPEKYRLAVKKFITELGKYQPDMGAT